MLTQILGLSQCRAKKGSELEGPTDCAFNCGAQVVADNYGDNGRDNDHDHDHKTARAVTSPRMGQDTQEEKVEWAWLD